MTAEQYQITLSQPQTAIEALFEVCPLSKSQIKDAMQKGAVWYQRGKQTQRIRRKDRQLKPGDTVFLYYNPEVLDQYCPEAILIADEGDFSVWYKPSGMLSQGSKWSDHCTINRWVETQLEPSRPAFIVNRLDRAAQGLMLIAHTKNMARFLSQLFEKHLIYKAYVAKVQGTGLKQQTCNLPIGEREATSHIYPIREGAKETLVKIEIESGRKHQIRIHLASVGYPIIGDRQRHPGPHTEDLALVSAELAWQDEAGKDWHFQVPDHYLPAFNE